MTQYFDSKRKIIIVEEIRRWIENVVNIPSDHFNGLPPCPYAKQAWARNEITVVFGGREQVGIVLDDWPENADIVIVVVVDPLEYEGLNDWCDKQNEDLKSEDMTLMPFVPGETIDTGQPDEEMTNWDPLVEEEYGMIFVQSLTELETASAHLMSKGYYKNCSKEFMEYVRKRSERAQHAWQKENGEENEEEANQENASQEDASKEALIHGKEEEEEAGFVREHPRETETHQGRKRREDAEAGKQGSANEQSVQTKCKDC